MPFGPDGYVELTLQEIIDEINALFIEVFGLRFNTNPASPNGQFINQLAQVAQQNQNFMVMLTASLYNPAVAQGVWLEALAALSNITRSPALPSTVTCTCTGSDGTVIPAGVLIANTNGDVFVNQTTVTISSGTASATFFSQQTGPIPVVANTVNSIINKVYGWDTVNNPSDGVTGSLQQSDNSLRAVRRDLLSSYGSASIGALYSGLVKLVGEVNEGNVFVTQNNTNASITVGGVSIVAYSIYVVILGSTSPLIAQTIYNKKCPGINQNGSTTYDYTDPESGTVFTAKWDVPTQIPLQVNISITNMSSYPPDFNVQIQNAIVNNFNGDDPNVPNALPVGIGDIINVSRFFPSLLLIGAYDIQSITIQKVTMGTPAVDIQLPVNQIGTLTQADVIVSFV